MLAPDRPRGIAVRAILPALVLVAVVLWTPGHASPGASAPVAASPSVVLTAVAGPPGAVSSNAATPTTANDWPEFHRTANLSGYTPNTTLSSGNASRLGVGWATSMYGAALDSPVVAYNPILRTELAYIATESGNLLAIQVANGHIVWGDWFGSPIRATPLVENGLVFVGTDTTATVFELNATTGATVCSMLAPRPIEGTPVFANPPGGVPSIYVGTEDSGSIHGPFLAMAVAKCTLTWSFTNYTNSTGVWTPASYILGYGGAPIIEFGTADPDSGVYALNASTGALLWRFQASNPGAAVYDIGAGSALAPPGSYGFTGGAAFVPDKYGLLYALSLRNGSQIWVTNFDRLQSVTNGTEAGRSTPALDGSNLVFGTAKGLVDLNPKTGAAVWTYADPVGAEMISSPAIAGPAGSAIVAAADLSGCLRVVALASGAPLYSYCTAGYVTASPAISAGNILLPSSDGLLYDFRVGGGNDATLPSTTIHSPVPAANLTNPNGNLTVNGSATDPRGVAAVEVAVQASGTGGPYWDAATRTWVSGPFANLAVLVRPGTKSTGWSATFPVPAGGGTFQVSANAESLGGQTDPTGALVDFSVLYSTAGPFLLTDPSWIAPGGTTLLGGGGFSAGEKVVVSLHGTSLTTLTASKSGGLPTAHLTIPTTTAFGPTSLVATGQTSGKSTTASVTIANSWIEAGYDNGHTGFEPVDTALNFLVYPGSNHWAELAWHFSAGHAMVASPVIAQGVAYVADQAGDVYAVATFNGGLLWTWTNPSGLAINSTPAVNATAGLLFVAGTDGTLRALSTLTGVPVWTTSLGGSLSPPVLGNHWVYVASSNGNVTALYPNNGSVVWTRSLGSAIGGAPALNQSGAVVVVGTASGNLVALGLTNGTVLWTFAAGGAVTASATVSGGVVYFGAANGVIYALHQKTGVPMWNFTTGGAIVDTGALSNKYTGGSLVLLIGSDDGNLYVLFAATGKLKFSVSMSSAIVGVAAVTGIVVMETLAGTIAASRTYVGIVPMRDPTGAGLASAPALVDGAIYVTGEDGYLYAYTTFGQAPD